MMRVTIKDVKDIRKQMFDDMERKLRKKYPKEEDGMFERSGDGSLIRSIAELALAV